MGKGLFISFEGVEGSGKSTQIELLRRRLEKAGRPVVATRAPGGTPLAESIRELLKTRRDGEVFMPETELLLFAACHSQMVENLISPALKEGKAVISDRFYDSTTAYQGFARGLPLDMVKSLNAFSCRGVRPDIVILLDLDPAKGVARSLARAGAEGFKNDRFDSEAMQFHAKVREGFLCLAKADPQRFRVFDAELPAEALHSKIAESLGNEFGVL